MATKRADELVPGDVVAIDEGPGEWAVTATSPVVQVRVECDEVRAWLSFRPDDLVTLADPPPDPPAGG